MITRRTIAGIALLMSAPFINAAEHTVKMVTSGANGQIMVMEPGYLKIAKGDTVNFVPSDPSHNAQSISIPVGAEKFTTPMGKPTKVNFNQEGVYVYKCLPHVPLGMVGVIQVGNAVNLEQTIADVAKIKVTIALNKERLDKYMALVK